MTPTTLLINGFSGYGNPWIEGTPTISAGVKTRGRELALGLRFGGFSPPWRHNQGTHSHENNDSEQDKKYLLKPACVGRDKTKHESNSH